MIESLTDEQRATFAPYAARWVREEFAGGRLDRRGRDEIVAGLRRCYAAAGLPWPDRVVWVSSPRIGAMAARAAAATVVARRETAAERARPAVLRWWGRARIHCGRAVRTTLSTLALALFLAAVVGVVGGSVVASVAEAFREGDVTLVLGEGDLSLAAWWRYGVACGCLGALAGVACGSSLWRSVKEDDAKAAEVRLLDAGSAEINATGERLRAATVDAVDVAIAAAASPEVVDAVRGGVQRPVADAVTPVWTVIQDGAADRRKPIRRAESAVRAAVGPDEPLVQIWNPPPFGGLPETQPVVAQHRDERVAELLWWRRHGGLALDGDLWARLQGYTDAGRVRWWPHPDFVMVAEPPIELHVERAASGAYQVHRADGPAVRWRDGSTFCFWRGMHVPADLIAGKWGVAAIHRHHNSELRRAAIERMGWLAYIERADLRLVASAPDPGNAPHDLLLYEDPGSRLGGARILVMTNGSPDRSGAARRYAEAVPGHLDDPVAAAAWQYDCPVETYRLLQRRT